MSQTTIWRMRIACWVSKAKGTQSDYVLLTIRIVLPPQKWFHERVSKLRYSTLPVLQKYTIRSYMLRPILAMYKEVVHQTSQHNSQSRHLDKPEQTLL